MDCHSGMCATRSWAVPVNELAGGHLLICPSIAIGGRQDDDPRGPGRLSWCISSICPLFCNVN